MFSSIIFLAEFHKNLYTSFPRPEVSLQQQTPTSLQQLAGYAEKHNFSSSDGEKKIDLTSDSIPDRKIESAAVHYAYWRLSA